MDANLVVRLKGGPRPMSVVVNPEHRGPAEFTAAFGPDDTVRFTGIPPGRARVEISRHAMPPMLALRTVELRGGESAEVEVVLDTLVGLTGQVTVSLTPRVSVEVVVTTHKRKGFTSQLSSDGAFSFRDLPQGPCTVEVRTLDQQPKVLLRQVLTEIPTGPLDLEVHADAQALPPAEPLPWPSAPVAARPSLPQLPKVQVQASAPVAPAPAPPAPVVVALRAVEVKAAPVPEAPVIATEPAKPAKPAKEAKAAKPAKEPKAAKPVKEPKAAKPVKEAKAAKEPAAAKTAAPKKKPAAPAAKTSPAKKKR